MRKKMELTQSALAEKLGISLSTYKRCEKGERTMSIDVYWRLLLLSKYYAILPIMAKSLDRYWHKRKKQGKSADADTKKRRL
jgi:transcriptional regulator with XRE-family HTH domain